MDSSTRRHTKEELGIMSVEELIAALREEGLPTGSGARHVLIERYLEGKKKPEPMTVAERKRKSRAKRSEDDRLGENARRREKKAARSHEQRKRENDKNAKQKAIARSNPEYRCRENARQKQRKRLWNRPPEWTKSCVPWFELNRAGVAACNRNDESLATDLFDERDAIVNDYFGAWNDCNHNAIAVVEGAGVPEINGRYEWVALGKYQKSTVYNGKKVVFALFSRRCTLVDCIPSHMPLSKDGEDRLERDFTWWHIEIVPFNYLLVDHTRKTKRQRRSATLANYAFFYERPPPLWEEYQSWRNRVRTMLQQRKNLTENEIDKIHKERRQILDGHIFCSGTSPPEGGWVSSSHGVEPPPKIDLKIVTECRK
jgi:hypothetical protein